MVKILTLNPKIKVNYFHLLSPVRVKGIRNKSSVRVKGIGNKSPVKGKRSHLKSQAIVCFFHTKSH